MNHTLHVLYHMVKADFLERVRRYSFLVILAGALYLAYAVVDGESLGSSWGTAIAACTTRRGSAC